jgi:3-methyl-2-oxobutanoate hydroxymethyltransferase
MKIQDFKAFKNSGRKISMITCYDNWSAKILNKTEVDCILVGDSLAMVMHGYTTTIQATVGMMALHTSAVARGAEDKFIVGDMPFLANRKSLNVAMNAVEKIMKAGAHAVKIEGAKGNLKLIQHIVESGVPVMGHLGLTPQSIHQIGGFKVQGRSPKEYGDLIKDAQDLENAGCFALVLECVPSKLAIEVTSKLSIPTIGIGAGDSTDGQVLVLQDMLGTNPDFTPKFLRKYMNGFESIQKAVNQYHNDVQSQKFPNEKESYQ